ncbi:lipid IV(A) 3-deoxy-D-manno-octulosonic acid transferase [Oceanisphaera avium]|uniref:3-deoxy-D-manno-octulosonic acid transferase n=1 Tax=Oceanisphaera avium TaxID=1903694 RepID=A0A1Y0CZP2_9GAMM|nr:lipid IV(A) 3-deoxy-D-manno-octulosonic acid transferase [Oceanisphaera avium]ART80336.1 3-deoxy-D-manno-octulosonic acid transferase [Oceanisphaera avium]
MYLFLYNIIIHLFSPIILGMLYWPKKGKPTFGKRWVELLGFVPRTLQPRPLWIHAVSVGEMVAATPLIKAIKAQYPELPIIVTTTTRTGADVAEKLGTLVEHRYAPLDFPWAVALFLRQIKPQALLIMETELWPNWLRACAKRDLPVMILNARLSARSARRYQRFHTLFRLLANNISHIACQYNADAQRFKDLGVAPEKLSVTGSIKFDINYGSEVHEKGQQLRTELGVERPVWIAASTHDGEDQQILAAHQQLLSHLPNALLILVPRHPQRFAQVAELITQFELVLSRRTQHDLFPETQVYLGDTMGELPSMLAAADIAFVGGSLIPRGGHNLLEPAALGKPVLTGPSIFNFTDVYQLLNDGNAIITIKNSEALSHDLLKLFKDEHYRKIMASNALKVVNDNKGAIAKSICHLSRLLNI